MLKSRHTSYSEKIKASGAKKRGKQPHNEYESQGIHSKSSLPSAETVMAPNFADKGAFSHDLSFEEAIQNSIVATSKGNPEEDMLIERAIRASVIELQLASKEGDEDDAIRRAIQASIAEASLVQKDGSATASDRIDDVSNHHRQLEAALRQSLLEHRNIDQNYDRDSHLDSDDPEIDTDDDENIKSAMQVSRTSNAEHPRSGCNEELQKTAEESRTISGAQEPRILGSKTEEEIILDYVKRQCEIEEGYRKTALTACDPSSTGFSDAELRQAMEESLGSQRIKKCN